MGRIISDGIDYSGLVFAEGCFIDTDNVIATDSRSSGTIPTYTATQDCFASIYLYCNSGTDAYIKVDNVEILRWYYAQNATKATLIPLKKGQVLSFSNFNYVYYTLDVYGIQQGSPITFLSEYASACYSDTEREVGCWVDGKPTYQKTVAISNVSYDGNWHDVAHGIANIDSIVQIKGIIKTTSNYFYNCDVFRPSTTLGTVMEVTATNISYINSWIDNADKLYVTLVYTKTTDTAGSGHLTPTGTPTHHYSTNEQVIGTWIDGKPLYEKTITGLSLVCSNANQVYSTAIPWGDIKVAVHSDIIDVNGQSVAGSVVWTGTPKTLAVYMQMANRTVTDIIIQYTKTTD